MDDISLELKEVIDNFFGGNGTVDKISEKLDRIASKKEKAINDGATLEYIRALQNAEDGLIENLEKMKEFAKTMLDAWKRETGDDKFDEVILGEFSKTAKEIAKNTARISTLIKKFDIEDNKSGDDRNEEEIEYLKSEIERLTKDNEQKREDFIRKYGGTGTHASNIMTVFAGDPTSGSTQQQSYQAAMSASMQANGNYYSHQINRAQAVNNREIEGANNGIRLLTASWNEFVAQIKKGANYWLDFNERAVSDAKRLGMTTKEAALGYTESLIDSSQELARNFGMSAEQAMKMRDAYIESTGRATLLSSSQMEDVAAAAKIMGQETVQGAIKVMDSMGSTSQQAVELLDRTYARAKNAGLDTTKASADLVKNLSLANKFTFRGGVDALSKMTIYAERIRMDLTEVANAAEKFSTIEGAIEGSAQLQALGGAGAMLGANPMEMLYEATSDLESFQKRLGDMAAEQAYFNRETGNVEIAPIQLALMKEQAKALGINPETFVQSAKQQTKLGTIESDLRLSNPMLFNKLTEEQKAAIGNKAEYTQESGWTITYFDEEAGKDVTEAVQNLSDKQLEQITAREEPIEDIRQRVREIAGELIGTRERWKSMIDQWYTGIAKALHVPMKLIDGALTAINNSGPWKFLTTTAIGGAMLPFLGAGWAFGKELGSMIFSSLFKGLTNVLGGFVGNLTNGIVSAGKFLIGGLFNGIKGAAKLLFNGLTRGGRFLFGGIRSAFTRIPTLFRSGTMASYASGAGRGIMSGLRNVSTRITNLFSSGGAATATARSRFGGMLSGLKNAFARWFGPGTVTPPPAAASSGGFSRALSTFASGVSQKMTNLLQTVKSFQPSVVNGFRSLGTKLSSSIEGLGTTLSKPLSAIKGFASKTANFASNTGRSIFSTIKGGLSSARSAIGGGGLNALERGGARLITSSIRGAKSTVQGIGGGINALKSLAAETRTISQLRTLATMRQAARVGAKRGGVAAAVVSLPLAAYEFYASGKEYENDKKRIKQQSQLLNAQGGKRFADSDIKQKEIDAINKRRLARGEAVGGATGAIVGAAAGGAFGAAIGSVVPFIGTTLGMYAGSAIGGWLGDKFGRSLGKKLTPEKEGDMIAQHVKEINKGDEKDNIRRIVLPVESIDYNVALIANQLGIISATPARGNIYLESEAAGERTVEIRNLHENMGGVATNESAGEVDEGYEHQQPMQTQYQQPVPAYGGKKTTYNITNNYYNYNPSDVDLRKSTSINSGNTEFYAFATLPSKSPLSPFFGSPTAYGRDASTVNEKNIKSVSKSESSNNFSTYEAYVSEDGSFVFSPVRITNVDNNTQTQSTIVGNKPMQMAMANKDEVQPITIIQDADAVSPNYDAMANSSYTTVNNVTTMNASQTESKSGELTLNVNGSIDLKMSGMNVGQLTAYDLKKLINENPQIVEELQGIIFNALASNGNGAYRINGENPNNQYHALWGSEGNG